MGKIFGFLISIDTKIDRVIAPLVRFWTEWTGMSNFALSKVLLGLAVCVLALRGILLAISTSPLEGGIYFLLCLSLPGWRLLQLKQAETAVNQESASDTLSAKAHALREQMRIVRSVFVPMFLYFLLLLLSDSITLRKISSSFFLLLILLELYVTYEYTPRGGSKIKKLLKQLAALPRSIKFPRPVPFPT
ncbi:MAG: hypothetical protein HYT49_02640 [Candidatus Wildermuthbacteria bacterium]|nr:hypothetical protein [Candidatus Wildermuthbacteria bacterium]